MQSLKQDKHPSSKHHLTNTCKESELCFTGLLSAILLLKQALMSEVSWNHQECLPEGQAWDYFPLILLMLPGIRIAPIVCPVPTSVLLQVFRCWGFIPPYLKIHALDTVFSLAFQLCSPWLLWESVWTLERWKGKKFCYCHSSNAVILRSAFPN